jgi:hypothetical protein
MIRDVVRMSNLLHETASIIKAKQVNAYLVSVTDKVETDKSTVHSRVSTRDIHPCVDRSKLMLRIITRFDSRCCNRPQPP